ncbi:hypothetical protein [Clostridium sp.]|uniref:hypothetical protein n=1 Tax=Clostridium sp. TaxID=1506 RepID=UPI0028462019|nr:hypothetical protein [Clostridium sp.]MDR3593995.1 hypothetical protein [Clostridium sp.]
MDELLNNFLSVSGFDYNTHVGKEGTGKLDIQAGANSGDQVLVKIGSLRVRALGVKFSNLMISMVARVLDGEK